LLVLFIVSAVASPPSAAQEGQMAWAVHTTLVPTWFASEQAARAHPDAGG